MSDSFQPDMTAFQPDTSAFQPQSGMGANPAVSTKIDMDAAERLASERAAAHTIYEQCVKYGDFSLFERCPELTRQDLQNADFLTIHPEDLVNINEPDEGWKGYWFLNIPGNPSSFRDRLTLTRKMGFHVANTNDGFRTETFQVAVDGTIHYDVLILLVQRSKQYKAHQENRNVPAKHLLETSRQKFHDLADQYSAAGIGTFEAEGAEDISPEDARQVVRPGR